MRGEYGKVGIIERLPPGGARWRALGRVAGALAAGALVLAGSAGAADAPAAPTAGGIWKVAVPPKAMAGEFDGFDPLGVAAGARIKADCSLNWIDPDDGKRYCFSSGTSLEMFLDMPHAHIARARAGWHEMRISSR